MNKGTHSRTHNVVTVRKVARTRMRCRQQAPPRDVTSTDGRRAVVLRGGDVLGCRIEGFEPSENTVRRY